MKNVAKQISATLITALALSGFSSLAQADKLDDVISEGELRCGVVLDFPPIGYRDANNEPAGFDVEYCHDLAKALDVDAKVVPVTWAERLPSIVNNRTDVIFGGTSDTLQRAKTVGFSIPYAIYYSQGVINKDSNIKSFEDLKGKRIAAAVGTVPEKEILKYTKEWGTEDLYQGYQSENEVFLAVAQGKADIGLTTNTAVKPVVAQFNNLQAGPRMPWTTDYTSVAGPRKDLAWLNYLNLFVTHQVRSGRYEQLWAKYVGGKAPELRIPGVMY